MLKSVLEKGDKPFFRGDRWLVSGESALYYQQVTGITDNFPKTCEKNLS